MVWFDFWLDVLIVLLLFSGWWCVGFNAWVLCLLCLRFRGSDSLCGGGLLAVRLFCLIAFTDLLLVVPFVLGFVGLRLLLLVWLWFS